MKIRPLHDRVVVKRMEEERTSAGGIVIPDSATQKPSEGEVIAVGKGKVNESGDVLAMDVKVGDKILFGKYSGTEIKIEGQDVLIMREEDILGVIAAQSRPHKQVIHHIKTRLLRTGLEEFRHGSKRRTIW